MTLDHIALKRAAARLNEDLAELAAGKIGLRYIEGRWGHYLAGDPHWEPAPPSPARLPATIPDGYRPFPDTEHFVCLVPAVAKDDLKPAGRPQPVRLPDDVVRGLLAGSATATPIEPPPAYTAAVRVAEGACCLARRTITGGLHPDGRVQVNFGLAVALDPTRESDPIGPHKIAAYGWWQVVQNLEGKRTASFSYAMERRNGRARQVPAVTFKRLCKGETA